MLYEDIPHEFKLRIKTYFETLCNSIKDIGDYQCINGTIVPKNLKSQHNQLDITSQSNLQLMTENFFLLDLFHKLCNDSDVFYSLFWGDMIGYYREGGKMLWDDDIDLVLIGDKGTQLIHDLWNNGREHYFLMRNRGANTYYKYVNICGYDIVIIKKCKGSRYHFKLKLNNDFKQFTDICGIDVVFLSNGVDFWNIDLSILNNYDVDDTTYPVVKYGPIDARILIKEPTTIILNKQYGPRWNEKTYPTLYDKV